ncbi:hypothetical protein ERO13_A12G226850v2 [Gossypium hirsutum]|nr:hypothetical protein ERO13_A12G226850v2 [Gossypium hirsutum]
MPASSLPSSPKKQQGLSDFILLSWRPPHVEWFKLNTDGSSMGNLGKVGVGVLIQDHLGRSSVL